MNYPAQDVRTEEEMKRLDTLSGLLVVLFAFLLLIVYVFPTISTVYAAFTFSY